MTPVTIRRLLQFVEPFPIGVILRRPEIRLQRWPLVGRFGVLPKELFDSGLAARSLREAAVIKNGDQLGPVGAAIVSRTFVRMLKRDGSSYLHWPGGFTPSLKAKVQGQFTFADVLIFAGANQP